MRKHRFRCAALIGPMVLLLQPAFSEDTLESVEKRIRERWRNVTALSATMKLRVNVTHSWIRVGVNASGPLLIQGGDGAPRYRSEMKGTAVVRPFFFLRPKISLLLVSDGKYLYTEQEVGDKIKVTKSAVHQKPASSPGGGAERLSAMKARYDCKLLPSQRFEGREVYVIECRPKEGVELSTPNLDRMILYFDKETGFQIRTAAYAKKKKKPMTEMVFSDLELNPKIDPSQFVYTPPKDVEIIDETAEAEG